MSENGRTERWEVEKARAAVKSAIRKVKNGGKRSRIVVEDVEDVVEVKRCVGGLRNRGGKFREGGERSRRAVLEDRKRRQEVENGNDRSRK